VSAEAINVEVAYAKPDVQVILRVEVPAGTTLEEAVRRAGLLERFPEIDLAENKVGVWSKVAKRDTVLGDGDRVEIYRPLIADPKAVRKQRAAGGKVMKKGAGEEGED